jgi:DnaJ-class molecular chaperone
MDMKKLTPLQTLIAETIILGDSRASDCEECEGSGMRSFYECDKLVDCVNCNGTGKQTLASESQREAAGTADEKSDDLPANDKVEARRP